VDVRRATLEDVYFLRTQAAGRAGDTAVTAATGGTV
jgi:hypothetical protein